MHTFAEDLKYRIPEYLQDSEGGLTEYLEACGELFDELHDTIKEHDVYKDYKKVPEARLSLLARRFAFSPPRNLPSAITRGIIRDISGIYTTKGVVQALTWVFRLIGWGSTIEYAWLLNPERYDPNIKTEYPKFFERDGLENDASSVNTFFPKLGDGYNISDFNARYHNDPGNYIIDGPLLIGRNTIRSITGEGNPYIVDIIRDTTDFNKLDYRNFVYGNPVIKNKGTFFKGHTYFSRRMDVQEAKIIGESYREEDIIKYYPSVISTPYIVVKVDSEDYDRFTRPYVAEDGTTYSYTTKEKFEVAQTLIGYLLYNFVRPSTVKIVLVTSGYEDYDQLHINEPSFSIASTSAPWVEIDIAEALSNEVSTTPISVPVIGTENFLIGAPSYLPYNSMMQGDSIVIGQTNKIELIANNDKFNYWRLEHQVEDVGGGIYETRPILLRTPSSIIVDVDESVDIYGRISIEQDYVLLGTLAVGSHTLDTFDYLNVKFRTTTLNATINTRVTWNDPSRYAGAVDVPYLNIS